MNLTRNFALSIAALSGLMLAACSSTNSKATPPSPAAATVMPAGPAAAASTTAPAPVTAPAQPVVSAVVAPTERECKKGSEVRKLSLERSEPKGCKLHYEKGGSKSVVASSASGTSHCESVEKRIRENLSSAGYKCTE